MTLFERGRDALSAPRGDGPPRYDRAILGRFDPNVRPLPPVVRYVSLLRFAGESEPSQEPDPEAERRSEERRRSRRNFNVVRTVYLPPTDVPGLSRQEWERMGEAKRAREVSSTSSDDSDDTVTG